MTKPLKLSEIAARIQKYLSKFEADPTINIEGKKGFFLARSWASGSRVFVKEISYQGSASLTREQALKYLEWLDAGNTGTFYKCGVEDYGYKSDW